LTAGFVRVSFFLAVTYGVRADKSLGGVRSRLIHR
jgi:hypothetical protein